MINLALIAAIVIGCLGWSGWWAIPLGGFMYWGSLRAIPNESHRINAVGIPLYMLGAFVIMKIAGWIAGLLT